MRITDLMMHFFGALFCGASALFPFEHVRADPCNTCADICDLENRLKEVKTAIDEYLIQIKGMEAKERSTGKPLMVTEDLYKRTLQPRVQDSVNKVTNPKAHKATGETDAVCEIVNRATTQCMKESVERHEQVHRAACLQDRIREGPLSFSDYKFRMRLVDLAKEEIKAYQAERDFLLNQLESVKRECDFVLEFESEIVTKQDGGEVRSHAQATVPLTFNGCDGLIGEGALMYSTATTRKEQCYVNYAGVGSTTFKVINSYISWRQSPVMSTLPQIELGIVPGMTLVPGTYRLPRDACHDAPRCCSLGWIFCPISHSVPAPRGQN